MQTRDVKGGVYRSFHAGGAGKPHAIAALYGVGARMEPRAEARVHDLLTRGGR